MNASLPAPGGEGQADNPQSRLPDGIKGLLAGLGGVAVAVIALLTAFGAVTWSAAQTALVTAEAAAVVGFITACVAHLWPGTKKETVALGGTMTALVAATLALLSGFGVWKLTQQEVSALVGLVTAMVGVGTALFARGQVNAQTQPKTFHLPLTGR